MEKLNITEAQSVLLDLVRHNLYGKPLEIKDGTDWSAVIRESIQQSMPLIAFKNHGELPLDEKTSSDLQVYLKMCTVSNVNCYRGHEYLHRMMTKHGLPYCIIKGAASAKRYPDPMLRSMGDVDFYIPEEFVDRAREIFVAEGFEPDTHDHAFHLGLTKKGKRLEMHYAPIASPDGELGEIFSEYWSDICERASLTQDVFAAYMLPSDFHHGFILLTHLRSHIIDQGVGLRHVCDWAVFADAFSTEDFAEMFECKLKRVGLWRFAQAVSLASELLFGMPHKSWMGDDYATAAALAEDILRTGNFGAKEDSASLVKNMIAMDYKPGEKKKRGIARAFASANAVVRRHWSAAEKCPIIYPFGWVYFSIRFLIKRALGKHKIDVVKSYKRSKERADLYDKLKIFEPED